MDSFKMFMNIFERAVAEGNSNNLVEILTNSRKYFQHISKDDSELVLSILFDRDKGLLAFLNNELKSSGSKKDLNKAMKEAFNLLGFIMEQFSDIFVPYIINTKNTCQQALITKCSSYIQKAACNVLNKLIQRFNEYDLEWGETIRKFKSLFCVLDIKERCLFFSVLGTIIKYNAEVPEIKENANVIFQQLRSDFKKQFNPTTMARSIDTFEIYLDVLTNMLSELPREVVKQHCKEIYCWIKELSRPEIYSTKKVSLRAAIDLLAIHMNKFGEFVYSDYEYWHKLLLQNAEDKNAHYSKCGQRGLKRFYEQMGDMICGDDNGKIDEDKEERCFYLKHFLEEQLKSSHLNPKTLRCAVYGLSQIAEPSKTYLGSDEVRVIFSLISNYALSLFSSDDLAQSHMENIAHYLEALSKIVLYIEDLSLEQINIITKLSILLVKKFPYLPVTSQTFSTLALVHTIDNVGLVENNFLKEFLHHLTHDGVVWSCSHTLLIDAKLQHAMNDTEKRPTCYKDFLNLWFQILEPGRFETRHNAQEIADSLINVAITLISKLNLNTKRKEDNVFSDAAFSQVAENPADFRMFINIVDLYVDIFRKIASSLVANSLQKFILMTINMSYKYPMVSGFYKLAHAAFGHIGTYSRDNIDIEVYELIYKYLMDVLDLIPTFSNELLTTCLYLILHTPHLFVERILWKTIPAFKISCTLGLSDFDLACATLNALERWANMFNSKDIKEFLREIVPFLESYLHSGESSIEFLQDIIKTERKVIKRIIRYDEDTLERFQMKILLFIASLDSDITSNAMYERSMNVGATWDKKDLLKYSLTFSDTQVDIHFDKILPRLMLLAQNSGDRRIKISACEVLHSLVSYILGKTSQHLTSNADKFVSIYMTLYPTLLNLGCDSDEAARNIFQPLTLQLTHWLSSKFMLKSPATIYFLDSLFDGLTNESNTALREFSGICLAEFTKWSIKQSDDGKTILSNIDEVMYKITNFALHPSTIKRIAAATAFNHLYTILREDEQIVSTYWLEILYCFIKSLNGCNDISIITALDHVERVLIAKEDLLNEYYNNRRKPHDFEDITLTNAVHWLFTQCGCLNQCCRTKCMELVSKLSIHINDCDSARTMISNYIDTYGIEAVNRIILKDLKLKTGNLDSHTFDDIDDVMPLLKALDCYIWLIRNDLLDVQYLLGNTNTEREVIFNLTTNFIYSMNKIKIKEDQRLSKECDELQTLKCKVITTIFDFLQILLNLEENFIPAYTFNKDLYEIIAKCIMCPQVVGFGAKNLEITEALPSVVGKLLLTIKRKMDYPLLFIISLLKSVKKRFKDFLKLTTIINDYHSSVALQHYVRGLIFLERHHLLKKIYGLDPHFVIEDIIDNLFKVLVREQPGEEYLICLDIKSSVKSYLQTLMEFLLMRYKTSVMGKLLILLENDEMTTLKSAQIERGSYFLHMFKNQIFTYMLKDPENVIELLDALLSNNPYFIVTLVEQLFLFVHHYKKELRDSIQTFVHIIIKKFTAFKNVVSDIEVKKQQVINIFGIAVHLMHKPMQVLSLNRVFYTWIISELLESSDIQYKVHILENFLICLVDMTSDVNPELLVILCNLRSSSQNVSQNDFDQGNLNALKIINCFQTLLSLLTITKSVTMFQSVTLFAAGIAKRVCNEKTKECLRKYFSLITTEYVVKSLDTAYMEFINLHNSTNERFDILHHFLLQSFQFCNAAEIHQFFEKNIKQIHAVICQSLVGSSSDIKQLIISKTGYYELVAIMLAKLDIEKINNPESVITRNAINNVITGKELLQSLYASALKIRELTTTDPEHKEIMRLLHCSAYNCTIAIMSSLKKDEGSYYGLFVENRAKRQLIWDNIVDCQKQYNFQQTVEEYPKYRKRLINIRKTMKQEQMSEQYSYYYSNDLSMCTLNEDINAYDFNETKVQDLSNRTEEGMTLTFEIDELNNHECMPSICGVIHYMITEEISKLPTGNIDTMPKWLKAFADSITSTNHNNVRLFMLKIVLNMQTVFKSYAKFLMLPIMFTVYKYLTQNQLNYIIFDVVEMLIDWQITYPENLNECKDNESRYMTIVQEFWEMMIHKVIVPKADGIPKSVYKYTMNLLKTILEVWKAYLKLPANLESKIQSTPEPTIYLILICLSNGMEKDIISRKDVMKFLEQALEDWKANEGRVLQTISCFGLILKSSNQDEELTNRIIDKIRGILRKMHTTFENRQIKCILALSEIYPEATMTYFEFVTANICRVDTLGKSNCLKIFLKCIPNLSVDQILKELSYMEFHNILKNKILPCEKEALEIINSLTRIIPASNLLTLANLVSPYTKNESSVHREIAYNIFINIYKEYVADISEDNNVSKLMLLSTEMLLNGILDPAEALQDKILEFWTREAQLTDTCKDRLLEVLAKYTPAVSNNFLPFALLMILDLVKKSSRYTEKLFEPLQNCSYKDYKIALSWRTKNLGSKAPLFAPSLTSQMNQTFTQMNSELPTMSYYTSARSTYGSDIQLGLRATQSAEFEPTYIGEESKRPSNSVEYDGVFKIPKVPQPAHNKRSTRFLTNSIDVSEHMRQKQIAKNKQRVEMIREESARQRSSIKLYRKYRIGDFPDIEISHASLIEPLQQLAKRDQLICKDLIVSIVCTLLKEYRGDNFIEKVVHYLKEIIQDEQVSYSTANAILEILLDTRVTSCSPKVIAKASKSNNLNFLGSLVLEQNLIYGNDMSPPPVKKQRTENANNSCSEWLQLTNLYQSMNNIDVVLSISRNHITNNHIQIASVAQTCNDWVQAKAAYEMAYENESESIKEYCLQGLLESLSNLCDWVAIDKRIKNKLNNNINNIWNDPWKDWMLPWMFEEYVRRYVDCESSDALSNDIKIIYNWCEDETKMKYIKRFFGEQSSMFFLNAQLELARDYLLNNLDQIREEWIALHPLSVQLKIRKLEHLRIINDAHRYIKIMKMVDNSSGIRSTVNLWLYNVPSSKDTLLSWDKLISYRIFFMDTVLEDKLKQWDDGSPNCYEYTYNGEEFGIIRELQLVGFHMRMKMIESSLNQKHKYIAIKYLQEVEHFLRDETVHRKTFTHHEFTQQFLLSGAKMKYLMGETESSTKKKLSEYTSSWRYCHHILDKQPSIPMLNVCVKRQISKISSRLVQLSEENESFAELLMKNEIILRKIDCQDHDISAVRKSLEAYSFKNLKECCNMQTGDINLCYHILAQYCYSRLSRGENDVYLSRELVMSSLKAMEYGFFETAHYFPCLLKPEYFADQETKDIFIEHSKGVETWLFLAWQAQLFSHLGTSMAPLILPILKRIADTYPNAVIYTCHLTMETNPSFVNESKLYEIRKILYDRPEIERFLSAMQYVVQPELYLQHYLIQFIKNLSLGTSTAIDILLKKVYPNQRENRGNPRPGSIFMEIVKYKNKIKGLEHKNPDEIKQLVVQMVEDIKESLLKRKDRFKLVDYSPWLYEFLENDIEIPGQYTGNRKPMPQYHTKIRRIEPTVKVMQSLRKPIKITMVGNDAKEYHFLVKFGEDLRQDQRLQELFSTMNKILHNDPACGQRNLSIDTYQVVPLSRTVGLIQWVNNTRSLQELIQFTLTKPEANRYDSILKEYEDWMRSAAPSKRQYERYKEAVLKYNALTVISKMNQLISKTEWDTLRRTFSVLCPSVESFVTMRQNFVTSYATMCIAHWILGIGDRHLGNTLITIDSGRCLGIDFGLAFDAGVDLRIPELMPFRLTPQILGLLKPFTEKDLLSAIMVHTLCAIRNEQDFILCCMDVFVHEPLNWTEHVNKALRETEEDITDVKWVPMKKVKAVRKKLNGIKPSLITLDQLKEQHHDKCFDRYYAIVTGDDDVKRTRTKIKNNFLSPEEQVECLLDQATDLNILGRTFVGWKPWL